MPRHWYATLVGLVSLAACQSPTTPPSPVQGVDMRVTVSAVHVVASPFRGLALRARLENTGQVPLAIAPGIHLYFLDAMLGWKEVTFIASDVQRSPASIVLAPGQNYEKDVTFAGTEFIRPYVWPVGGFSGTYRLGFTVSIGVFYLSPWLTASDQFVVVDTAGR